MLPRCLWGRINLLNSLNSSSSPPDAASKSPLKLRPFIFPMERPAITELFFFCCCSKPHQLSYCSEHLHTTCTSYWELRENTNKMYTGFSIFLLHCAPRFIWIRLSSFIAHSSKRNNWFENGYSPFERSVHNFVFVFYQRMISKSPSSSLSSTL